MPYEVKYRMTIEITVPELQDARLDDKTALKLKNDIKQKLTFKYDGELGEMDIVEDQLVVALIK